MSSTSSDATASNRLTLTLRHRRLCTRSEITATGVSPTGTTAFAIYATTPTTTQSWIDVFDLASPSSSPSPHAKTSGSYAAFRPGADRAHLATLRDWTVQLAGGVEYTHASTVLVRDYASGKTAAELKEARGAPLAWSRDGKLLAAGEPGGEGGRMGIWDVRSGARVGRVISHTAAVTHAVFTPTRDLITLSRDGTLRISNPTSSRTSSRLDLSSTPGQPRALALARDGRSIVAIWGSSVYIWLPEANHVTSYELATVRRTEGWPLCVSGDGRWLVSRTEEGFDVMDVASGTVVFAQASEGVVTAAAVGSVGREGVVVLGRMDGVVEVWDMLEKRE